MNENDKLNFIANAIAKSKSVMERVEDPNFRPSMDAMELGLILPDGVEPIMLSEEQAAARRNQVPSHIQSPVITEVDNRLNSSNLPDAIKKSFRDAPPIDPTQPAGMELLSELASKKLGPTQQTYQAPQQTYGQALTQPQQVIVPVQAPQMDTKLLEWIIEKTVKETVQETLNQLSKQTSIDENFQIKIGNKVFGGKLNILKENTTK